MKTGILCCFATVLILQNIEKISTTQCIHPPDAEHKKLKLQQKVFHDYLLGEWTYKVIDDYRRNTRPQRPGNLLDIRSRRSQFFGNKSCKKNRNFKQDSSINSKATCPWYTVIDVDLQREPQSIAKAKCSCKRCFSVDRNGKTKNRCTEVNSFIPVLKWRCQSKFSEQRQNYFEYFVDFEAVPVGCTCHRPVDITAIQ